MKLSNLSYSFLSQFQVPTLEWLLNSYVKKSVYSEEDIPQYRAVYETIKERGDELVNMENTLIDIAKGINKGKFQQTVDVPVELYETIDVDVEVNYVIDLKYGIDVDVVSNIELNTIFDKLEIGYEFGDFTYNGEQFDPLTGVRSVGYELTKAERNPETIESFQAPEVIPAIELTQVEAPNPVVEAVSAQQELANLVTPEQETVPVWRFVNRGWPPTPDTLYLDHQEKGITYETGLCDPV